MQHRAMAVETLVEPVVTAMGYELWGVEILAGGPDTLVRVYIDSADGIAIGDCERVSHQLSGLLDVERPVPGGYTLEVSSPGLDRLLFRPEHYARYAGSLVDLKLRRKLDGRRRYTGTLREVETGQVVIETDGERRRIPMEMIEKTRLKL